MVPPLCPNGCGFYGSAANKNFCSKCYKDYNLKENNTKSDVEGLKGQSKNLKGKNFVLEPSHSHEPCASESPITEDVCAAIAAITLTDSTSMKGKKKRCKSCNKKIGLTGFECRCGDVFCGRHRYPEVHACNVDLKRIGRQILAEQNPKCVGDKLEYRV